MDGRDADRASSIGDALRCPAGRGASAPAQAFVVALRGWSAIASGGRDRDGGQVRAYRRLRAGSDLTPAWSGHGGSDRVAGQRERGTDRAFPHGGARALGAGASVAHRASGQGRGTVTRRDRTTIVPKQELGVAPTGTTQGPSARGAGQSSDRTDSTAGRDEISVAVGPGQRRSRAQASHGTRRTASFSAADRTAFRRVPGFGPGGARTALRFTTLVSASGCAYRACGAGEDPRGRASAFRSWCHRGTVWARPPSRMHGHFRRGICGSERAHRGRAAGCARGGCDSRRGNHGEAFP